MQTPANAENLSLLVTNSCVGYATLRLAPAGLYAG